MSTVLTAHARRAVADPELAADLVQETAVAALRSAGSFEGRSSLRSWLVGILAHKIMDHYGRARRAPETGDDDGLTAADPSAQRRLEQWEALDVLERALPELPDLERLAVLLVDIEGLPREEARNAMDVSATHLRVLLHRGRHRLRKALIDAGMSPRP
jgi:RNA polymerase sigma-70 factor (ECF subfamily)